jgi:sec-independent protein translocase protein TatA
MFGIGGGELFFIILVVLMLFGSDKIPDIARALGKGMAQLKNATNEIKNEIHKGTQDAGLDMNTLTGGVSEEIAKAKEGITKMVNPMENINLDVQNPIEKVKEDIESITGPVKRQM